jgi:quinoprotein dehydrogenase-associated probable ABC transporter substrate-binding protein
MFSVSRTACAVVAACAMLRADGSAPLRVCSDPNNMPFSNQQAEGFENKIAALIARDLQRSVSYFWAPQRRGFIRNTLAAGRCDVVMGVPAHFERVRSTQPYYRSTYVFVSRQMRERGEPIRSFDDRRLTQLTVGIQITGDDYNNPPAAQALAARHIVDRVRGYPVYGDYSKAEPQREIVDAVAAGTIDLAVVWGPVGGYFARREPVPMTVVPVNASPGDPLLRFIFDIAIGVRRDDVALQSAIDRVLVRRRVEIRRILTAYGVPLS